MENGYDRKFAEKFSGLAISGAGDPIRAANNNNDSSLFQVMKAVEAAEATIKQQVEENIRLRTELENKILELDRYKVEESGPQRPRSDDRWPEGVQVSNEAHQPVPPVGSQEDRIRSAGNNTSVHDPSGTLVLHQDILKPNAHAPLQNNVEAHSSSSKINGTMKELPGSQQPADNICFSHLSSPSTTSFSPGRFNMQGEYDPRYNFSGQGLMPVTEVNPRSLWKQDLIVKIHEHEEEIMQLRKHLLDYSIKEAQIRNEKYVLEKRIAYMRLAFDQQQQDLVDAASKALSYRQDIIEENIRLTYALQDAQQERTTFVSSLLPLLAEYSLQPPVDAQSIVSNVKVLFKHLQEKLLLTETKLKESQYHLRPWNSELNNSNIPMQSPSHSLGAALTTSNKNGLELVPQQTYTHGKVPVSASDVQTTRDWDLLGRDQSALDGVVNRNLEPNDLGRYSPFGSRNPAEQDTPTQLDGTQGDTPMTRYTEETTNKQVTFRDPVRNNELDDQDHEGNQIDREMSTNWSPGNTPYTTTPDEPSSSYPHFLPPVLEEPSSSFSEAADDDPLPAIENLQISGEAFPGRELQASGYSINGTTTCNFEWVRHMEDGSVNYIEGAKQPNYLITADDVNTYLAIEVQPLDNRKRKGELVKVFANENRKITCDPEMQGQIEKIHHQGHSSFKIYQSTGYLDIWEPAILAIKKDSYSIKCTGPSSAVFTEKFSPTTSVVIPYGSPTEFVLTDSGGNQHPLKTDNDPADYSCSRDTVVLTLRMFSLRAGEKKKKKKRGLIF